jgi:hypothetical protein
MEFTTQQSLEKEQPNIVHTTQESDINASIRIYLKRLITQQYWRQDPVHTSQESEHQCIGILVMHGTTRQP